MSRRQGIKHNRAGALSSGGALAALRGVCIALPLLLIPALSPGRNNVYYQVNTGTVFLLWQREVSRYWNCGPSVGGEVGCYLGEYFSPSVGFSYTHLSLDWDEVRSEDEWVKGAVRERYYILTGSFALRVSDFEESTLIKSYISVGGTYLLQKTSRPPFDWDSPIPVGCQNGTYNTPSESKGMALIDMGAGIGVGVREGCVALIQAKMLLHPSEGFTYLPVEFGLRF